MNPCWLNWAHLYQLGNPTKGTENRKLIHVDTTKLSLQKIRSFGTTENQKIRIGCKNQKCSKRHKHQNSSNQKFHRQTQDTQNDCKKMNTTLIKHSFLGRCMNPQTKKVKLNMSHEPRVPSGLFRRHHGASDPDVRGARLRRRSSAGRVRRWVCRESLPFAEGGVGCFYWELNWLIMFALVCLVLRGCWMDVLGGELNEMVAPIKCEKKRKGIASCGSSEWLVHFCWKSVAWDGCWFSILVALFL